MGRRPNPQRREELLDETIRHVEANGLASLSLRPLASALGTSTYTLTYQFGSKNEIIRAILGALTDAARSSAWSTSDGTPGQRVKAAWQEMADPDQVGRNRLLAEQFTVGSLEGLECHSAERLAVRRDALQRSLIEAGVDPVDAGTGATVVCAMLDGLVLDLLATGDVERLDRAIDWLVDWLDQQAFSSS